MEEKNPTTEGKKEVIEVAILSEGAHEYTYRREEEGDIIQHSLFYSKSQEWSEHIKGELVLRIIDDGHGYKINKEIGNSLEYDTLYELGVLLRIISGQKDLEFYQRVEF
jgi:hypothetical protein